jgi:long-subunit acyl-CoA synthetase (AMP-forming)
MSDLIAAIERQAQAAPAALALRSHDRSLSYAELMDCLRQAMVQLESMQVEALGLYLDNGIDWVIYDLAAFSIGIRSVPLPLFFSDAQIVHAIVDADLDAILFDQVLPKGIVGRGVALPGISDSRLQRIRAARDKQVASKPANPSSVAKISYTSGTTGSPQGIELESGFIEQTSESLRAAIGNLEIQSHLGILPYAMLLENIAGIYVPLSLGRCVYAESAAAVGLTSALGLDPSKLRVSFERIQPNSLILTPQLLEVLCQLAETAAIKTDCLVFVAVGGARVAPALMRRARAAGIPAYEGYGLTEFASVATLNTPANDRIGSVGKPLPGVRVVIADDGEICLARDTEVAGAQDGPKLIRSGDLGRIDAAGFVYVDGRKSNLIVLSNGRNIAPEWIEAELSASPLIAQSFVFSECQQRLVALLRTAAADAEVDAEIERINAKLPAYARLQGWYRLSSPFSREGQTLTANGRLRRGQIERQLPDILESAVSPAVATDVSPDAHHTHSNTENNPC